MALMSNAEFARLHGVSHTAVGKWKADNLLVLQGKKIDVEASNERLKKYRDSKDGRAQRGETQVSKKMKPETKIETSDETGQFQVSKLEVVAMARSLNVDPEMPIEEARRLKEMYLALLNQLEYDQRSGAVVLVKDVVTAVGNEYAKVRTRLLSIPAEQAPRIHQLKTLAEVQDYLLQIITEALEELTRDGANA